MKHPVLFVLILLSAKLPAKIDSVYRDSSYAILKAEVFYDSWYLSIYNRDDPKFQKATAEDVATNNTRNLTHLLEYPQSRELYDKHPAALNLSVYTNDSTQIRIYEFGYNCGGTQGWIDYAVMQWQSPDGKLHAYNLSTVTELSYFGLYLLSKDSLSSTYLLLGRNNDNAYSGHEDAIVLKLAGSYLLLNQAAFGNQFGVSFERGTVQFNPVTLTLTIQSSCITGDICYSPITLSGLGDNSEDKRLYELIHGNFTIDQHLKLKWNGKRFTRT